MLQPAASALPRLPLWIAGEAVAAQARAALPVTNPATGAVIREVPCCGPAEVEQAVAAARAALPAWRATPPLRRARLLQHFLALLQQHSRALAEVVSEEHGKTLDDALGSVQRGLEVVEFACGIPQMLKGEYSEQVGSGVDAYSLRQPVGVCAGITPFNFPVMVPLWMFPVAIACGNTFVLKPSEKVPSASMRLAELAAEAGLPAGVLNVVHGAREAVEALIDHPGVDALSFVGSTPVARAIFEGCARQGKRVQALGGAKNHAVVLPDADIDYTADALIGAAYGSAGERCMAISVVVAVGAVAEPLVAGLRERAAAIEVGPGDRPGVGMGPLVSRAHRDRVSSFVDAGEAEGAALLLDGRGLQVPGHEAGFFLGPSLLDHVQPTMSVYREEIFGPVLVVVRVDSLEEAIELVNASPYANGTAVFTRSGAAARRYQHEVEVGMVGINVPIPVPMAFHSFGGWKRSLFGDLHVHGPEGVKFYTRTKAVTSRWPQDEPAAGAGGLNMPTLG